MIPSRYMSWKETWCWTTVGSAWAFYAASIGSLYLLALYYVPLLLRVFVPRMRRSR